jgi:hypothetical protein
MLADVFNLLILGVGCITESPARLALLSFKFDFAQTLVRSVFGPCANVDSFPPIPRLPSVT